MKRCLALVFVISLAALLVQPANAQNAQSAFNQIKSLAGEWQGQSSVGGQTIPVKLTYVVISGGSAVMETMQAGNEGAMVSIYHENGGKLMMTHYCTGNNQPRLQVQNFDDPQRLDFQFLDISNLASPDGEYISGLVVTFKDKDHFTQKWSHRGGDLVAEFERVK